MRIHAGSYLLALGIGLMFSAVFFLVFRGLILAFDLKTPGREDRIASDAVLAHLTGKSSAKEGAAQNDTDNQSSKIICLLSKSLRSWVALAIL